MSYAKERKDGGPRTLQALLDATQERYWVGTGGEVAAVKNGQDVVNILGPTLPPSAVTPQRLDTLMFELEKLPICSSTVNRKLAALSKMLSFAHERGYINAKPRLPRKPERQHRIRWLSDAEELQFHAACQFIGVEWLSDTATVLMDTGLRLGELLKLRWQDCADGWIRVWESKARTQRSVPATTRVAQVFKKLENAEHPAGPFCGISQSKVTNAWNKVRTQMGLAADRQFVPHMLRHTFCTRLVQRGATLQVVAQLAGHKSLAMTLRYAHLAPDNLLEAMSKIDPSLCEQPEQPKEQPEQWQGLRLVY